MSLLAVWSPKGGSGTSVVAAACALVLANRMPTRLVDLDGDQPGIFGLAADPERGVFDWLVSGPGTPTEALDRLSVEAAPNLALLPRGSRVRALDPRPSAEAGAALGVALRDGPPTFVDAGIASDPAARALVEVADASLIVARGCYLTLRRAVRSPLLSRTTGIVVVEEAGRSLGAKEVADVLGRPVVARLPVKASVARTIDAGTLPARLPESLGRPIASALASLGLVRSNRDAA